LVLSKSCEAFSIFYWKSASTIELNLFPEKGILNFCQCINEEISSMSGCGGGGGPFRAVAVS